MPAPPQTIVYCTQADIEDILSEVGMDATIDDDGDGFTAPDPEQVTRAIERATARVNLYLRALFDDVVLAQSWNVVHWCSIIAAKFLSARRLNPVSESLGEMYEEAIEDLKAVRKGDLTLEVPKRNVDWPAWSNVTVDLRYRTAKVRVERTISEKTPTQYAQRPDWSSELSYEV